MLAEIAARVRLTESGVFIDDRKAALQNVRTSRRSHREETLEDPLVRAARDLLYMRFYAFVRTDSSVTSPAPEPAIGTWSESWKVLRVLPDASLLVEKRRTVRRVPAGYYRAVDSSVGIQDGDRVHCWIRLQSDDVQRDFRYYFSPTSGMDDGFYGQRRWYFNVCGSQRIAFAGALALELRKRQIAFSLKAITCAEVERRDSVVLYASTRNDRWLHLVLSHFVSTWGESLAAETPTWTRAIAPGVAVADSPPGGQSFGIHLTTPLAFALADLRDRNVDDVDERLTALKHAWKAASINEAEPWALSAEPFPEALLL